MRIAFIGGGTMGEAMIRSLLTARIADPQDVKVSDISASRREWLNKEYKVRTLTDNKKAIKDADLVILAVKPQDLPQVMKSIKILPGQLVLSIVAGASLSSLSQGLNHMAVIRAMPNMPAQIGKGITVWTATTEVNQEQKKIAQSIFSSSGEEIHVTDEKYLDMATALSGSGPAYVFLFMETLVDAGVHIGLPRNIAEKLVVQTVLGSAQAIPKMSKHPAELRNMVTSPGGTTAAALLQIEKGAFRSSILEAVAAAYNKAKFLALPPDERKAAPE
ncbi:MAG: pyrroline-5-carboxylate reductase [Chloroflexota bacterium]|nr:pyrroline-5-carboxylate reductase [Chloroflexota bacterium]